MDNIKSKLVAGQGSDTGYPLKSREVVGEVDGEIYSKIPSTYHLC